MITTFKESAALFDAEVAISSERAYDAFVLAEEHPHVEQVKQAFTNIGLTPITKQTGGGSDANNFNQMGITTVNISTGMAKVHTIDEHIAVEDMVSATKFLTEFLAV